MSVYFHNKKIAPIVKKEVEPEITGYAEVEFPVEIDRSRLYVHELSDHTIFAFTDSLWYRGDLKLAILNKTYNRWDQIETPNKAGISYVFITQTSIFFNYSIWVLMFFFL